MKLHELLCPKQCDKTFRDLQHILLVCTVVTNCFIMIFCSVLYENGSHFKYFKCY